MPLTLCLVSYDIHRLAPNRFTKVLPSKLDWFLSTIDLIWEKIAALSFRELWYFNAKVRYYYSFDIHAFYTVQKFGVGWA